jgi:hypothetical protein
VEADPRLTWKAAVVPAVALATKLRRERTRLMFDHLHLPQNIGTSAMSIQRLGGRVRKIARRFITDTCEITAVRLNFFRI